MAWRDQSSPCLQHEAPVFSSSARSFIRTSDRMPAWPCRRGMDLYLYVDRSSINGHVPPLTDMLLLYLLSSFFLTTLPTHALLSPIIICQGWYKCKVFALQILRSCHHLLQVPTCISLLSVTRTPFPFSRHTCPSIVASKTKRYWRAVFGNRRQQFCVDLARQTIH